jgi:hypothetical protein
MHIQSENMKVRDHLGDLGVDGRIILKWIHWLRIEYSGGLL